MGIRERATRAAPYYTRSEVGAQKARRLARNRNLAGIVPRSNISLPQELSFVLLNFKYESLQYFHREKSRRTSES